MRRRWKGCRRLSRSGCRAGKPDGVTVGFGADFSVRSAESTRCIEIACIDRKQPTQSLESDLNKRQFLATAALGAASLPTLARPVKRTALAAGPALLTVTGAIGAGNRGPLDAALDQMMHKQGVKFDRAHTFDFAALTALPALTIRPTLEYDGKPHTLRGPLLTEVVAAAGAPTDAHNLLLRAIDGYAVAVSLADARK